MKSGWRWGCCLLTCLHAYAAPREESRVSLPFSIAAIGDSSTSGVLASYERKHWMNPLQDFSVLLRMLGWLASQDRNALSDRSLSWSTGIDPSARVISHARRLAYMNPKLKIFNAAQPSLRISEVAATQIEAIATWSQQTTGARWPNYTTVFAGANDLCADRLEDMTPVDVFERSMESIVSRALGASDASRLLILPLMRLDKFRGDVEKASVAGKLGLGFASTCADIWKMAPVCRTLTDNWGPSGEERLRERIDAFNQVIRGIVTRARARYGDRIRIVSSLADRRLDPDELSVDCFHPSHRLQNSVAAESFKTSWWSQEWSVVETAATQAFAREKRAHDEELRRVARPR